MGCFHLLNTPVERQWDHVHRVKWMRRVNEWVLPAKHSGLDLNTMSVSNITGLPICDTLTDQGLISNPEITDNTNPAIQREHIRFAQAAYSLDVLNKLLESPTKPFAEWFKGRQGKGIITHKGLETALSRFKPDKSKEAAWDSKNQLLVSQLEVLEWSGKVSESLPKTLRDVRAYIHPAFPSVLDEYIKTLSGDEELEHWVTIFQQIAGEFGNYEETQGVEYLRYPKAVEDGLRGKGLIS